MTIAEVEKYLTETHLQFLISIGVKLIIATVALIVAYIVGNWLENRIEKIKKLDKTVTSFLGTAVKYAILGVALISILGQFGVQTTSLLAVLGAAGLAIGLALQGTLSNVAAGVMLLFLRPFRVGDYIVANGRGGTVKSLRIFGTELTTPDNVYIFLPNNQIWNNDIWNYSRNATRRQDVNFGIGFEDDIGKAIKIVQKILEKHDRVLKTPDEKKPQVMMDKIGGLSVELIARFWSSKDDYWTLRWEITQAIKEALDKEGINIPALPRAEQASAKK